jgi:outer membrane protein assembly factor BamB
MKRTSWIPAALAVLAIAASDAGAAWTKRMGNNQNTNQAGPAPGLTPASVEDLKVREVIPVKGAVNATPVVSDGLLFIGDGGSNGRFMYVFDLERGNRRLIELDTGATVSTTLVGSGVQSTAMVATVTVPNGTGGTKEERRLYFGANVKPKSFWCLNIDAILARRDTLDKNPGKDFLCKGADWPILIAGLGVVDENTLTTPYPLYNASPVFSNNQEIRVGHDLERRDVIYTPTIGADCSDGQLWAIDAYTAEVLWTYDPVPNFQKVVGTPRFAGPGYGGVIWTVPAMSKDGKHLYVTTGDCVEQPQIGFQAESLVAIDPVEGVVKWWHQRRLTDATDYDIGNSPVVVDVEGENGCHNVVSTDKNGCIYGFRQTSDIPQVGGPGYDPTRVGQQRVLYRQCFVTGSLTGGFNASGAAFHDRWIFAQANNEAPGDNASGFAIDACTGKYQWATADVSSGQGEGAIASGMWFQPAGSRLQVLRAGPKHELLATVPLPVAATPGGGGPAIVGSTIYVPVRSGVAIVEVVPGSNASRPQATATTFNGPYPAPLGTGVEQVMVPMPIDPYDPDSPPAPENVADWPTMQTLE